MYYRQVLLVVMEVLSVELLTNRERSTRSIKKKVATNEHGRK